MEELLTDSEKAAAEILQHITGEEEPVIRKALEITWGGKDEYYALDSNEAISLIAAIIDKHLC